MIEERAEESTVARDEAEQPQAKTEGSLALAIEPSEETDRDPQEEAGAS